MNAWWLLGATGRKRIAKIADAIDSINQAVGNVMTVLVFGCALIATTVALLRYAFNIGFTWLQDLYVWQHALVFMLAAGFAYLHDSHVRVDIFYGKMTQRTRARVNIFGVLVFLLPWLVVLVWTSGWSFTLSAWRVLEGAAQPDGLPPVYLLKTSTLVFALLLGLQGISALIRDFLMLTERQTDSLG